MSPSRKKLYGKNFLWFATDSQHRLGFFLSGYGPIPKVALNAKENDYLDLKKFLEEVFIADGKSTLSKYARKELAKSQGSYELHKNFAKKGCYVYEYEDYKGPYRLIAVPQTPKILNDMPANLRGMIFKFDFLFENTNSIELFDSDDFE